MWPSGPQPFSMSDWQHPSQCLRPRAIDEYVRYLVPSYGLPALRRIRPGGDIRFSGLWEQYRLTGAFRFGVFEK